MKRKKAALLNSVLSLILCISMLLGTTFAWFTDSVTSENNIIKSGRLDAAMEWKNPGETEWKDASTGAIFNYEYWEPGYVDAKCLKLVNAGNLAFQYRLFVVPNNDMATGLKLAEVLDVYVSDTEIDERTDIAGMKKLGTLKELMANPNGVDDGVLLPAGAAADNSVESYVGSAAICIALKMQETAGNEYQNRNFGDGFKVQLLATQYSYENDSFGKDYDTNAQWPEGGYTVAPGVINYTATTEVTADANGELDQAVSVGNGGEITAAVPAGVKLADGATALELSVKIMSDSQANVTLENGETKQSLDIHVAGVSEENTVPMTITLPGLLKKGLNTTSVAMYHVEDGVTVPMTLVTNPTNHNEFSYDPMTGTVVVCTATFSEYVSVTDNFNRWEGGFNYDWYVGKSSPYTISSADQLAGFGQIVDGTSAEYSADDFAGDIVYLGADIDLSGGKSLNPIGCGYADSSINTNKVTGRPFRGTFDGQNHIISGLYQNGWDLGLEYCNLGGGLFASIADGTVRNLTISGANIVMECVEQGILVGLSQGNCTYENIEIYNSKVANYQKATGGLIGEVSPLNGGGTTAITDVVIGSDVVVGSLWGDFDAPVGGVIGARWDDGNTTKIVMDNVTVAAKLDVYNDVTSTYQWYAYRRAGMLIGNTEQTAAKEGGGTVAAASFLTCENVQVKYGSWVNYHYCEFNNHNPNWPWVRVEAGENCNAYSNPRYGVPNDPVTGQPVTSIEHNHSGDDEHNVELKFNQLYGGGQGVYGQTNHDGVQIDDYDYTVTYKNSSIEVLKVVYWDNTDAYNVDPAGNGYQWLTSLSAKAPASIPAGNTTDYIFYKDALDVYTARFVDQYGNVVYEETFLEGATELNEPPVPNVGGDFVGEWEEYKLKNEDITIKPVYVYQGNLQLTPVDSDNDGQIDSYQVDAAAGLQGKVEIPGIVNGYPVKVVVDVSSDFINGITGGNITEVVIGEGVERINANALAGTLRLNAVTIPTSVNYIGANAFASFAGSWVGKTVTITYLGTIAEWNAIEKDQNWANGLSATSWDGSEKTTIECSDGTLTLNSNGTWTPTYKT